MAAAIIFRYTVKELKNSQDNGQWETFECIVSVQRSVARRLELEASRAADWPGKLVIEQTAIASPVDIYNPHKSPLIEALSRTV